MKFMLDDHGKSRLDCILQSLIEANDIVWEKTARLIQIFVLVLVIASLKFWSVMQ